MSTQPSPRLLKKCPNALCSLWVWVRDADTKAIIPGAKVSVTLGPAKPNAHIPKNSWCKFENLPPGDYTVTGSAQNVKGYEKSKLVAPETVNVHIDAGDIGTATLWVSISEQIAIQLVDPDNRAVATETYKVTAPSGKALNTKLNGSGYVKVDKVRPGGNCQISFPEMDIDLWEFVDSTAGTDAPPVTGPPVTRNTGPVVSPYTVVLGDCIASIAFQAGVTADSLWNANEAVRNLRKDRCVLMPGDSVTIPPKRQNVVSKATTFTHKFRLKAVWEYGVEILLADIARDDVAFELSVDEKKAPGNKAGMWTTFRILPNSKAGKATVSFIRGKKLGKRVLEKFDYTIELGCLRPAETPLGAEDRLRNLGYYGCWPDGVTPAFEDVLRLFQLSNGIEPADGTRSPATINKLKELTGDPA